jgi:hypothetical protein
MVSNTAGDTPDPMNRTELSANKEEIASHLS